MAAAWAVNGRRPPTRERARRSRFTICPSTSAAARVRGRLLRVGAVRYLGSLAQTARGRPRTPGRSVRCLPHVGLGTGPRLRSSDLRTALRYGRRIAIIPSRRACICASASARTLECFRRPLRGSRPTTASMASCELSTWPIEPEMPAHAIQGSAPARRPGQGVGWATPRSLFLDEPDGRS